MKIHGDFGDLSRYDLHVESHGFGGMVLKCRDCGVVLGSWITSTLAEINRMAAEHETTEVDDQTHSGG